MRFGCCAIQRRARRAAAGVEVFVVGLVQHDHDIARHRCEERRTAAGASQVPVGLFGLATNTIARRGVIALRASPRDRGRSRAPAPRRRSRRAPASRADRRRTRAANRPRGRPAAATPASRAPARRWSRCRARSARASTPKRAASAVLEREAVAVGIARDARRRRGDRRAHLRARAARVFVRGELDDRVLGQARTRARAPRSACRARTARCGARTRARATPARTPLGRGRRWIRLSGPPQDTSPAASETARAARSSASAAATGGSSGCPSRSTKNRYSQRPVRAGRDSRRLMLTPCLASGSSSACTAPGRFCADITSEVSSLPERGRRGVRAPRTASCCWARPRCAPRARRGR